MTVRLAVPSKLVAPGSYASTQWTASNDAFSGSVTPSSQSGGAIIMPGFDAVTGSYGGLFNRQTQVQSGVVATANLGSLSITSQSYPGVTSNLYIVGVPHLDALLLCPPDATGQNTGNVSISFDGGATWKAANTYYQDPLSSTPSKAGIATYLRTLQPLFVV